MDTDRAMQDVINAMELLPYGSTQSWNPTTSGGRDRDPRPPGESYPLAEEYRDKYHQASNDFARQRVLHEARNELERWRGHGIHRHPGETQAAIDARMVREGEGWTVDEVARAFHCTRSRVRAACNEHKIEIDYQERLCAAGAVSKASLAQTMYDEGRTQQQVADTLGIHQSQISRLIGTRRKAA